MTYLARKKKRHFADSYHPTGFQFLTSLPLETCITRLRALDKTQFLYWSRLHIDLQELTPDTYRFGVQTQRFGSIGHLSVRGGGHFTRQDNGETLVAGQILITTNLYLQYVLLLILAVVAIFGYMTAPSTTFLLYLVIGLIALFGIGIILEPVAINNIARLETRIEDTLDAPEMSLSSTPTAFVERGEGNGRTLTRLSRDDE